LYALDECRILVDGTVGTPRLDHPECVTVGPDGAVWCGGELGQVYRVEADGSGFEEVARTGGFSLGLAFGPDGALYVCDLASASVLRVEVDSGRVEPFASGTPERRMVAPNYPVFDEQGRLYVSDSGTADAPGPGIYRFAADGTGELWHAGPLWFANGLALAPDGRSLVVVETFARAISRIAIEPDGSAGAHERIATVDALPDGVALGPDGSIYVGCYEPSMILRVDPDGQVRCLVTDPTAHTLCHPTNVALLGDVLLAANLGRWHITALDLDHRGETPDA
jgi:sugar lactone lactonase YvrE